MQIIKNPSVSKHTVDSVSYIVLGRICCVCRPAMAFVAIGLVKSPAFGCLVRILVSRGIVRRGHQSDGLLGALFDRKRPALFDRRAVLESDSVRHNGSASSP